MKKEQIDALVRELREAAKELPAGKRRDVYNKLERIDLHFRRAGVTAPETETAPVTAEEVRDNCEAFASQRRMIQQYLLDGHRLTTEDARRLFGASRLPNRIMEIGRILGKSPKRRRITVTNRFGKNVSVCEYWIEREDCAL